MTKESAKLNQECAKLRLDDRERAPKILADIIIKKHQK